MLLTFSDSLIITLLRSTAFVPWRKHNNTKIDTFGCMMMIGYLLI